MPRYTVPSTGAVQPILTSVVNEVYARGESVDAGRYGEANLGFVTLVNGEFPGAQFTVTAASWAAGVVTLTIGTHGITLNQVIGLSGLVPSAYNNGGAPVAVSNVPSGTQIKYPLSSDPGTYTSGGTVTVGAVSAGAGMLVRKAGVIYQYTGSAWATIAGLSDPGGNGIIKRTALNVTGPATAGTDYVAPVNAPTAWAAPTLLNSWANVAGYAPTKYRIDELGEVHIRASLMSGTITDGTALFVLPAGLRPPVKLYIPASYSSGSYLVFTALQVDASGNVTIGGVTGNSFLSINTSFSTLS